MMDNESGIICSALFKAFLLHKSHARWKTYLDTANDDTVYFCSFLPARSRAFPICASRRKLADLGVFLTTTSLQLLYNISTGKQASIDPAVRAVPAAHFVLFPNQTD
jgi:hypothetical protein